VEDHAALFDKAESVATAPAPVPANQATPAPSAPTVANPAGWICGAKTTCGQMSSCDEVKFYLKQCGLKNLDRDSDGALCASLCNR
jgi:hypothetical protein